MTREDVGLVADMLQHADVVITPGDNDYRGSGNLRHSDTGACLSPLSA